MFKRAVLITDFTSGGILFGEWIERLTSLGVREAVVTEAVSATAGMSLAFSYDTDTPESLLEQERERLSNSGIEVENAVITGRGGKQVADLARERDASLVVVGTEHHSIAGEALGFNFAWNIIGHSPVPVLTIPLKESTDRQAVLTDRAPDGPHALSHVLIPTDFSDDADQAFGVVESDVAPRSEKISLLHVQDSAHIEPHLKDRLEEFNRIDKERLAALQSRLSQSGCDEIHPHIAYGQPVTEILKYASENAVSLVVLGRKGRGRLKEALLGGVSHNVLRASDIPTLVVPAV